MKTFLILLSLLSAGMAHAQSHYRITNLGVLPGDTLTYGYGLNNRGDVVGYCSRTPLPHNAVFMGGYPIGVPPILDNNQFNILPFPIDTSEFPFLYHAGKIVNFAPNGLYGHKNGRATAINDLGQIGGEFFFPMALQGQQLNAQGSLAYVYNGNFKPLTDGHHASAINCVNNQGIFGGSYTPTDQSTQLLITNHSEAFVFVNNPAAWGKFTQIIAPGITQYLLDIGFANGVTNSINSVGQAVGYTTQSNDGPSFPLPWIYFNGKTTLLTPNLLWTPNGINNHGQIVGQLAFWYVPPTYPTLIKIPNAFMQNALVYQNGVVRELPPLPGTPTPNGGRSSAVAINDAGTIVGSVSSYSPGSEFRAVRWQGTQAADLNTLAVPGSADHGVTLTEAVAINQSGQILCNGTQYDIARAFLLTPSP